MGETRTPETSSTCRVKVRDAGESLYTLSRNVFTLAT